MSHEAPAGEGALRCRYSCADLRLAHTCWQQFITGQRCLANPYKHDVLDPVSYTILCQTFVSAESGMFAVVTRSRPLQGEVASNYQV